MAKRGRNNFEPLSSSTSPSMGDLTIGDYANGMPNIRLGEMFKSFGRQMRWVIPLMIIGTIGAWFATSGFARSYFGEARVVVRFNDDYAYNPVGQTGQSTGLSQTIDTITLTEAALMKNGEIIDDVIELVGAARIAPISWQKVQDAGNDETKRKIALMESRNEVGNAYVVMPRAKSSVIDVKFEHENPDIAVEATNAFISTYIESRKNVFDESKGGVITERRQATEDQLNLNEKAIARFLKKNQISDFGSEQEGLQDRTETLKADLNETRASISETEGALSRVEDQLRGTTKTIDLFRDDISAQRVAQAELELRQLMAKYLPTSDPVRQKTTELNELRSLQNSYGGRASGGRRVGPNPTYQTLEEQRNVLASTADSLREREFTLQGQLNSADGKIRRLTSLSPEYQNLLRERETLETRLTSYNVKEQEALVDALQSADQAENVTVISWAKYPSKGRNMRVLMFVIAALGWGFILFFIAMIRVFLTPSLYYAPGRSVRGNGMMDMHDDLPSAPAYDPIPEAVPGYDPGQPASPNPYDRPAAGYATGSAATAHAYGAPAYAAQNPVDGYAPTGSYNQATQGGYDQYTQPMGSQYDAAPFDGQPTYTQGNAALDVSSNPYASGTANAGAFEAQPMYSDQVDEFGRPITPPTQ